MSLECNLRVNDIAFEALRACDRGRCELKAEPAAHHHSGLNCLNLKAGTRP